MICENIIPTAHITTIECIMTLIGDRVKRFLGRRENFFGEGISLLKPYKTREGCMAGKGGTLCSGSKREIGNPQMDIL